MRIIIAFLKKQAKYNFFHLLRVTQDVKLQENLSVSESRKEKISNFQEELSQVYNYLVLEAEMWLFG